MNMKEMLKVFVFVAAIFSINWAQADQEIVPSGEIDTPMNMDTVDKGPVQNSDVDVASTLFGEAWEDVLSKYGEKNIVFPKQVVFLNGAPGAGKGTNTITVMRTLEIPSRPIEVSSLLNTPECEKLKEKGMLVSDDIVIKQVMNELLKPENVRGIIIDGFPRTAVQAYFLRCLIEKLNTNNDIEGPIFRMINFSVSRQTSIVRQLSRGDAAVEQNKKAETEGVKHVQVRPTDLSVEAASRRYQIYEKSIGECIDILKPVLDFYEINSEGSFKEVRNRTRDTLSRE
jgi:adenylate kinase